MLLLWFYYNWEEERLALNVSEHQVPIGDKKKRGKRVEERMSGRGNAQNWMCATGLYKTRRWKEQEIEREREHELSKKRKEGSLLHKYMY